MRIISSTGYGSSGSTAITDLISEYSSVQSCKYTGYELKFFHNPRGIFNLYNNLIKNDIPSARFYAITEYKKFCHEGATLGTSMNYEKFFCNTFGKATDKYLEKLCGEDYITGYSGKKVNAFQQLLRRAANKTYSVWQNVFTKKEYGVTYPGLNLFMTKEKFYLPVVDEQAFTEYTKQYFTELFIAFAQNHEFANVHELVPIQMMDECTKYFEDICIIKIDRDPRDIYLNRKYRASSPFLDDVETFCKHARWLRNLTRETSTTRVLNLQFEDLVYSYDDTVKKIEEFCGLRAEDHVSIRTKFIPELAVNNCNLKEKYPEEAENIRIIERELSDLLYDFEHK